MRILIAALALVVAAGGGGARAQLYALSPGDSANQTWLYPASASQATDASSTGAVYSSFNSGGTLTLTLPANASGLQSGWHVGVVNDNGHRVTVQVNPTAGGQILFPDGHAVSSFTTAAGNYEYAFLEYDNGGNFRLISVSPTTAAAIGMTGTYITGPGSSTDGWVPTWSGASGTVLTTGHPVANAGAGTVLETDIGGKIDQSVIPDNFVKGPASSTDGYVARWSGTTGNQLGAGTAVGNSGANTVLETDSSGRIDYSTLPIAASGSGGQPLCVSGTTIYIGSGGAC